MSVSLENVSVVSGGDTIIDSVSLELVRGGMNILLGPTLAGKTTLMRLMAGLDKPTGGRVLASGRDVTGVAVQKRSVAMVYQQFINYPSLTVFENIASPLRVARLPSADIEARVRSAANVLGLEPFLQRLPAQLSGGQQQRTAIARAIVKDVDLVLMDEPLANLDYKLREELREELPRILRDSGATLVYATTEPLEALQLGGHTATLSKGRVTQFGRTETVYHRPDNIESARVFSDPPLNEFDILLDNGVVLFGERDRMPAMGALTRLPNGPYKLGFRAEAISLDGVGDASLGFEGKVAIAEISGSESFVHVETAHGTLVCVERGVSRREPGQKVDVRVDAARLFVFDPAGRPVAAGAPL